MLASLLDRNDYSKEVVIILQVHTEGGSLLLSECIQLIALNNTHKHHQSELTTAVAM